LANGGMDEKKRRNKKGGDVWWGDRFKERGPKCTQCCVIPATRNGVTRRRKRRGVACTVPTTEGKDLDELRGRRG